MPNVEQLSGLDPIGASLVQSETGRLQADTQSLRDTQIRGQELTQQGQQFKDSLQAQKFQFESTRNDRIMQQVIEERLAKEGQITQARIMANAARYHEALMAGDAKEAGEAQQEREALVVQQAAVQKKLTTLGAVAEWRQKNHIDGKGLMEAVQQKEAGEIQQVQHIGDAVLDGITDHIYANQSTGDQTPPVNPAPSSNVDATVGPGWAPSGNGYEFGPLGTSGALVPAASDAVGPPAGVSRLGPKAGASASPPSATAGNGIMQVAGEDTPLANRLVPRLKFLLGVGGDKDDPTGAKLGEAGTHLAGFLQSLERSASISDPVVRKTHLDQADQEFQALSAMGVSDTTLSAIVNAMDKMGAAQARGQMKFRVAALQGQLAQGGTPPVDVGETDPGKLESIKRGGQLMQKMAAGAMTLGHAATHFHPMGNLEVDDKTGKLTISGHHQDLSGILNEIALKAETGQIQDPQLLENLPDGIRQMVREKLKGYDEQLKAQIHERGGGQLDELIGTRDFAGTQSSLEGELGRLTGEAAAIEPRHRAKADVLRAKLMSKARGAEEELMRGHGGAVEDILGGLMQTRRP